jgi:Ser/Thr protein kinase RdoA (MazF antagonist)
MSIYTYSRFSGDALVELVLSKYEIASPLRCDFFVLGLHDNYIVEAGSDNYILRIYRNDWRSKEEIFFELELLTFLHNCNIPVAYPLFNRDKKFAQAIEAPEGLRYAVLYSYAPGKAANERLSESQSFLLGKTVAELHNATNLFESNYNREHLSLEYLLDRSLNLISPFLQKREQDIEYLFKVRKESISHLEELPKSAPIYGICIGDIHSRNAHFTEDNRITIFDFDQCGYGWRAFDIGKFIVASYKMGIKNEVINAFVNGYQEVRRLEEQELRAIPIFMKVALIWMLGIYVDNINLVGYKTMSDEFFNQRIQLLKDLEEKMSF